MQISTASAPTTERAASDSSLRYANPGDFVQAGARPI